MKRWYMDIEANGLDFKAYDFRIWCMCIRSADGEERHYTEQEIKTGVEFLLNDVKNGALIIGHNIIHYDMRALAAVTGLKIPFRAVRDTLVMARLIYGDLYAEDDNPKKLWRNFGDKKLYGSQSLKAWGLRLGELKGSYGEQDGAWDKYTPEMLDYCKQDVRVTEALYNHLVSRITVMEEAKKRQSSKAAPIIKALDLEHRAAMVCADIEDAGYTFDRDGAIQLLAKLSEKQKNAIETINKTYWTEEDVKVKRGDPEYVRGAEIWRTVRVPLNAASPAQLSKLLEAFNYAPDNDKFYNFDAKGNRKSYKTSEELWQYIIDDPEAPEKLKQLAPEIMTVKETAKLMGMIAKGQNAWLKLVRWDDTIHHEINPCGTVTGRATHSKPNLAQVPAVGSTYGADCRALFGPPKGWVQLGIDASGLELRCLAHYLAPMDNGNYGDIIQHGDIHTHNQEMAGLATRAEAKTFIYAYLYGAGNKTLAQRLGKDEEQAAQVRAKFRRQMPAIGRLEETLKNKLKKRRYIYGLDGRYLYIREDYRALNTLLQSAGAIICKAWVVCTWSYLQKKYAGKDCKIMGWIHDEMQIACRTKEIAEDVSQASAKILEKLGKTYNFGCPLASESKIGSNWAETH